MKFRLRSSCALLLAVSAFAAAGCGGGDASGGDADQQALTELSRQIASVTKSGDARAFCELYDRAGIIEQFKSVGACARDFGPVLKRAVKSGQANDLRVGKVDFQDGRHAVITFKGNLGTVKAVKTDDAGWRLEVPTTSEQPAPQ